MTKVASVVLNNFTSDNRVYKMALSLREQGYDVHVVALLKGDVKENEVVGGIPVHRVRLRTMVLPEGVIWGGIKYIEMFFRIIAGYRKFDIWHCNDFEPFLIGRIAKFFNRKLKLVYDCHEYESERYGKAGVEKKFIAWAEKRIIGKANAVINVSKGIAKEYKRLYNIDDPVIIYNAPHKTESLDSLILREKLGIPDGKSIFLYQGGLAVSRGIELLLQTFSQLEDRDKVIVFMGKGEFQPMVEEYATKHDNIYFHPSVPYEQLLSYTSSADYGIISTQNLCLNNYYCMPNKLFEYIQAEIPVLTNNLFDCRNMVETHQIGVVAEEYETESLIKAIREISSQPKAYYKEALRKVKDVYHWENEEKKLIKIYKNLD